MATRLALALKEKGCTIDMIYSRTLENSKELASKVDAKCTNQLEELKDGSDLYIIALKDDIIEQVLRKKSFNGLIAHTSGSFETSRLSAFSELTGCFYPLQTFSKHKEVDFTSIPFFIESENKRISEQLSELANKLSDHVQVLSSEERKALHIAAVSVNNFTHFILSKTKLYCKDNNLNFNFLQPLIKQTVQNIEVNGNPIELQTGPARRNDLETIKNHLTHLESNPEFKDIYQFISKQILTHFHGQNDQL